MDLLDTVMDQMDRTFGPPIPKRPAENERIDSKRQRNSQEAEQSRALVPKRQEERRRGSEPSPADNVISPSSQQPFGSVNSFQQRSSTDDLPPSRKVFGLENPFEAKRRREEEVLYGKCQPSTSGEKPYEPSLERRESQEYRRYDRQNSQDQRSFERRDSADCGRDRRSSQDDRDSIDRRNHPRVRDNRDISSSSSFDREQQSHKSKQVHGEYGSQERRNYEKDIDVVKERRINQCNRNYDRGLQSTKEYNLFRSSRERKSNNPTNQLEVQMNALKIHSSCEKVYRYHVTMIRKNKQDKEKDITKTPVNDQAAIAKEYFVFNFLIHLYKIHPEVFGNDRYAMVYDGGPTLYTRDKIITENKAWVFTTADMELNGFPPEVIGYLCHQSNFKEFKVGLAFTNELYISGLNFELGKSTNREAQKFYDVLLSAYAKEGNFLNYGQRSYEKEARGDEIGKGKEVKKGLEKTTKFVESNESAQIICQVSAKATAFYKPVSLLQYIGEFLGIKNVDNVPQELLQNPQLAKKASAELKNIFIKCRHNGRFFCINKINVNKTPMNTEFEWKKRVININDYFARQYNYNLKYPNCPMAVERFPDREAYYPLEICDIAPGHRCGTASLGPLAEKVHQKSRTLPHEQKQNTMKGLRKLKLTTHDSNPYLEAFNISLESDFIRTMACVLQAPTRIGANNQVIRGYQGPSHGFYKPAKVDSNQTIFITILDECIPENRAYSFWERLQREATKKGIVLPKNAKICQKDSESRLSDYFEECKRNNAAIILFFTKEKKDDVHHVIKVLELRYSIQTQHISSQTVSTLCGESGTVTVDNILRKFNPKLGGVNERVQPPIQEDATAGEYLKNRMFVGLELSHPAAQSAFDRQFNVALTTPTVVGMAMSLDIPEALLGRFWYQEPRVHNIKRLGAYFKKGLEDYKKQGKPFHKEIVIYRHGLSEGDMDSARKEIDEIREAARQVGYNPSIVFMLCIKHSGTTLMPADPPRHENVRAKDVNVPSGTVLDTELVAYKHQEFLIKSQESIIGTSHMLRIIVVQNDRNVPLKELEKVTHWIAFAHQSSSLPVSRPHVLYAASELSKRGINHFKQNQNMSDDDGSVDSNSSSRRGDMKLGEDAEQYYERKSAEIAWIFMHHYWA